MNVPCARADLTRQNCDAFRMCWASNQRGHQGRIVEMPICCTSYEVKKDALVRAQACASNIMAYKRSLRIFDECSDEHFKCMASVARVFARQGLSVFVPNLCLAAWTFAPQAKVENKVSFPSLHPVQDANSCTTSGVIAFPHFVKISLPERVMRR